MSNKLYIIQSIHGVHNDGLLKYNLLQLKRILKKILFQNDA